MLFFRSAIKEEWLKILGENPNSLCESKDLKKKYEKNKKDCIYQKKRESVMRKQNGRIKRWLYCNR